MRPSEDVITTDHLKKYYKVTTGILRRKTVVIKAVDDVSLTIKKGEIVGLVGESGSGKTTLARLFLKLITPTESTVFINGTDIFRANGKQLREIRKKASIVFQDPAASLNPRVTIGDSIMRPLLIHGFTKADAEKRAKEVLNKVQLDMDFLTRYPHQLSGGQQQRVSIARALILEPEIIILDEPTSALDISVQAQILNLLLDLQEELHLTYLVITHDLNVIRYLSDKIAVMYLGKLVEYGLTDDIFAAPAHPYTRGLIASAPVLDPRKRNREKHLIRGEADSLYNLPKGCRLSSRCPQCDDPCKNEEPGLVNIGNDHFVACIKINDKRE
jgi:oligopeptide/dipeptide ABC transporter ATP-binding protein